MHTPLFLVIVSSIFLTVFTEGDFPDFHGYDHDESIHDEVNENDDENSSPAHNFDMSAEDIAGHLKDIVRGFSDKGVEESDIDGDGFIDVNEIEHFIKTKMGFNIKTTPEYVIHHYDSNNDQKLSKDEIWRLVEDKDKSIFKMLPDVMENNMQILQNMQQIQEQQSSDEPVVNENGIVIRFK